MSDTDESTSREPSQEASQGEASSGSALELESDTAIDPAVAAVAWRYIDSKLYLAGRALTAITNTTMRDAASSALSA
ncbi:hypothetical protein LTR66_016897 [Elasticomyces elasticus]|nr:hypothetical protein LTR66_016897 [Elasticomyces elasticus]